MKSLEISKPSIREAFEPFGGLRTRVLKNGSHITLLPGRDVPDEFLNPDEWSPYRYFNVGNTRPIFEVTQVNERPVRDNNDQETILFVKSPERHFTTQPERILKGDIWWGGPRSGEKRMSLWGSPEIEDQTFEEALILMLLIRNSIRAEVPQAILEHSNGRKELVTKGIRSGNGLFRSRNNRQCYDQVRKLEVQEQWAAVDFFYTSNRIIDEQGYSHVIDVNRWQVPQLHFVRKKIIKLLLSLLSNSTNNAMVFTQAS